MQKLKVLLMAGCLSFVVGCWTLSIDPLYTAEDLEYDPQLVGSWGDPEDHDQETWTFLPVEEQSYQLIIREEEEPDAVFAVHLLRLGDELYLDIFPDEPETGSEAYLSHLIPGHSFWKFTLAGDVLTLDIFDTDWLRKGIDEGKLEIEHTRRKDVIVLTAPTKKLQEFVLKYAAEAFTNDPAKMKRIH